jgi:hypothetical protein
VFFWALSNTLLFCSCITTFAWSLAGFPLLTFMNRVMSMAKSKMSRATEIAIAIVTVVYNFYACY